MVRFGVLGLGFMGRTHLATLAHLPSARIVAVHDPDPARLKGSLAPGGGNVEVSRGAWDESGVRRCPSADQVIGDPGIDAVVVAAPTHLHAGLSCAALAAGKSVFCEKPMALTLADCDRMIAAARSAGRVLMIGQCLRFWDKYVAAAELVRSGRYGPVKSLVMSRRCSAPKAGAWFVDHTRSGGAVFDLHIHDVDYALFLLGQPRSVRARGKVGPSGGLDQVAAWYDYGPDGPLVLAEGGWIPAAGAGFVMEFRLCFERAAAVYSSAGGGGLHLYADKARELQVPPVNGHVAEIAHFVECVRAGADSPVVPPASSRQTVATVLAEIKSIRTGRAVALRG